MIETIGYINVKRFTDIHSFRVYREGAKIFAIPCKLKPKVEPEFVQGGFSGHCINQHKVWSGTETVDIGEQFEIFEKNGVYGCYTKVILGWIPIDSLKDAKKFCEDQPVKTDKWVIENDKVICYKLTETDKYAKTFIKLGSIEKDCKYFYDYNF